MEDDGGGINFKAIKSKAIKKGLVTEEKAVHMSDEDVIALLGTSGLSSTDKVTALSGRGVGFDVVRSQIESVGGQVKVESKEGQGTSISMTLPMSLAIISGLLISTLLTNVAKTDVKRVGRKEMITYRGEVLPLLRLSTVLNLESNKTIQSDDEMVVAIINKPDNQFALVIDGFERKQEFVIKQLDSSSNTALFPYATILSSGEVALILDPSVIS